MPKQKGMHPFRRLSIRITIVTIAVPLLVCIVALFIAIIAQYTNEEGSKNFNTIQLILWPLILPLLIGWIASRFITKPLRKLITGLKQLRTGKNNTEVATVGVYEFDEVAHEFNQLSKRLHTEEILRKNLIADISHDLTTPLAVLVAQLAAMQDRVVAATPERLGALKKQSERLSLLVAQLTAYTEARIPAVQPKRTVNLESVCRHLVVVYEPMLTANSMVIELNVSKGAIIMANEETLIQILSNLIQNAIRHSHGSTITITATAKHIIVSDNGRGVTGAQLPHLFERFYREQSQQSDHGLGLGLAIVRELVHAQGWNITAESAAPGLRIIIRF